MSIHDDDVTLHPQTVITGHLDALAHGGPTTVWAFIVGAWAVFLSEFLPLRATIGVGIAASIIAFGPMIARYRPWGARVLDGAQEWKRCCLRRMPRGECGMHPWRRCWIIVRPEDFVEPTSWLYPNHEVTLRMALTPRRGCTYMCTSGYYTTTFRMPSEFDPNKGTP